MFELECIHEVPDSRVGTVGNTFEPVLPPFRQVGGSRKSADGGIPLVPSKLVKEGISEDVPSHVYSRVPEEEGAAVISGEVGGRNDQVLQ